jgi:hypothetical protein
MKVKKEVKRLRVLPYVMKLVVFYATIYIYESQFKTVQMLPENTLELQLRNKDKHSASEIAIVFAIINIVASLYPL